VRFLKKLLGETDALEEAKREAGNDLEGGQVEAPEAETMPEEPAEMPRSGEEESPSR
jgi:hypothetical protein